MEACRRCGRRTPVPGRSPVSLGTGSEGAPGPRSSGPATVGNQGRAMSYVGRRPRGRRPPAAEPSSPDAALHRHGVPRTHGECRSAVGSSHPGPEPPAFLQALPGRPRSLGAFPPSPGCPASRVVRDRGARLRCPRPRRATPTSQRGGPGSLHGPGIVTAKCFTWNNGRRGLRSSPGQGGAPRPECFT